MPVRLIEVRWEVDGNNIHITAECDDEITTVDLLNYHLFPAYGVIGEDFPTTDLSSLMLNEHEARCDTCRQARDFLLS